MALLYRFKKEQLEDGSFVSRPRIPVILHGENTAVEAAALIDSNTTWLQKNSLKNHSKIYK